MRITGGQSRGRRLKRPRAARLRPTSSRVREALFDILGARIRGALFLDLFAGTGAVGIEALSRGAQSAVLVETDPLAVHLIEANLSLGGRPAAGEVVPLPARAAVAALRRRGLRFSVVFLDPPYAAGPVAEVLRAAAGLVAPGGVLVLEHRSQTSVDLPASPWLRPGRVYRYGDTSLTVLHRLGTPEEE